MRPETGGAGVGECACFPLAPAFVEEKANLNGVRTVRSQLRCAPCFCDVEFPLRPLISFSTYSFVSIAGFTAFVVLVAFSALAVSIRL